MDPVLPDGVLVGHATDREAWTGCTAVLVPDGAVCGGEVRGGGPGTRETDVVVPSSGARLVQGVLLTGGSAFGLAAADGVVSWLHERGHGHATRFGVAVPLVPAAVVFDLGVGRHDVRPGPSMGRAACEAASGRAPERGSVGAGTGCAAGKLLEPSSWTKTGVGLASDRIGGALVTVLAVANPVGEVLAEDGSVLAGAWHEGGYVPSVELLKRGVVTPPAREATTLVCVVTDAKLDRTEAWLVARACSAGVARATAPTATVFDGDAAFCLATGAVEVAPFAVAAVAAEVTAAAIRDAARQATAAPGVPSAADRAQA